MLNAKRYLIAGRVQGVGFRFFAVGEARRLNLRGYVRNLKDGRVEAYAMGDARSLAKFKQRLAEGPRGARVISVEEMDKAADDRYISFKIDG